jgi:hypothetical protein
MAISIKINKEPLYGTVYWDGNKFVYTPNAGFAGKDYYIYTITDELGSNTKINYVDSLNTSPLSFNISLTGAASNVLRINVNDYISDSDGLIGPLKLVSITPTTFGNSYIEDNFIVYQSRGFNSIETFKYTVSDGQFTSTAEVKVTILSGADSVIPQNILDDINDIYNDVNTLELSSVSWNETYTFVSSKSGDWNSIDVNKINQVSNIVEQNSANWNEVTSEKPLYDEAKNIVASSSANWNDVSNKLTTITNIFSSNSSKWDDTYTTLSANFAEWSSITSNISALSSDYYNNKPYWDSTLNTVSILSSSWDKTELTNVLSSNSANWNDAYTILSSNSANWDSSVSSVSALENTYNTKFSNWDEAYTIVSNNSAGFDNSNLVLNALSSSSANWDNSYNILFSNSAKWDSDYATLDSLSNSYITKSVDWDSALNTVSSNSANWDNSSVLSFIYSNSANWESTFNSVSANSGIWNNNVSIVSSLSTSFESYSGNWESTYNTICANSAKWDYTTISSKIENVSSNWDTTYNLVCANSTKWINVSAVYEKYDVAFNNLTSFSGNWDNSFTTLTTNSGNWSNILNIVQSNSSRWLTGGGDVDFVANTLTISGNAVIVGNLTAQGGISQTTTDVVSTSAFNVVNIGETTALSITKTLTTGAIASFDTGGSTVLYISPLNKVGINTDSPNEALTVVGNISASGMIYGTVPPEYTVFQNNSAKYEASDTYFSTLCGLLTSKSSYDNSFNFVSSISGNLNNFVNLSAPLYNAAYNVVTAQSANNNTSYNTLCSISASFGTDTVFRSSTANYTTAYNYVTSNSAAWVTKNPTFSSVKTTTLTSGNVTLTAALLTTFSTPITASDEFLNISLNGVDCLIQLWKA